MRLPWLSPKWLSFQSCPKVVSKFSQKREKVAHKLAESCPKVHRKVPIVSRKLAGPRHQHRKDFRATLGQLSETFGQHLVQSITQFFRLRNDVFSSRFLICWLLRLVLYINPFSSILSPLVHVFSLNSL